MLRNSLILSILAMTAIVGLRYLAVSGGFAWLTHKRRPALYAGLDAQIRREILWSLLSAFIYGAPAGTRRLGLAGAGLDPHLCRRGRLSLMVAARFGAVYLLVHDAWFYWTHRLMHRPFCSGARMPSTMPAGRPPPGRR